MADSDRRRKRATISCSLCRKRKIRCNRELPCSNCAKSRGGTCVYSEPSSRPSPDDNTAGDCASGILRQSSTTTQNSNSTDGTSASRTPRSLLTASTPDSVDSIKDRITSLEAKCALFKATQTSVGSPSVGSTSNIETSTNPLTEPFHVYHENHSLWFPQPIVRGVMHKTRLFGQSHWITGVPLLQDMIEAIEPNGHVERSKVFESVTKCKSLARIIKSQRRPAWPTPLTTTLPSKDVTDELVDRYLRTIETVYRILHVPTFRREYEKLWVPDAEVNPGFRVQLKLVLAIGAATYDERFSLRASAIRWIYEAQTWMAEPAFKPRLCLQALQIHILLLFAREAAGVGANLVWTSVGSLLRTAIHMGLHRDPEYLHTASVVAVEMRRRIWNTILELSLLSSLSMGGPPLLSESDFDTKPPRNFDDDQLTASDPSPKLEHEFTNVSISIALRKSFAARLAVIKFLNNAGPQGTYDETLRLDSELRTVYRVLYRIIQGFVSSPEPSPSSFEVGYVDILIHRFILALHVPFFGPAMKEIKYSISRKVVVETSLKVWCTAYPSSAIRQSQSRIRFNAFDSDYLPRLTINGSGFLRTAALQASFLLVVELRSQLREEEGLGSVPIRTDLLSVLEDSKRWSYQCIDAGQTNIKGYLLMCLVSAHVDAMMQGQEKEDLPDILIKTAEAVGEECVPKLEEMLAESQTEGNEQQLNQMSLNFQNDISENWDFMLRPIDRIVYSAA